MLGYSQTKSESGPSSWPPGGLKIGWLGRWASMFASEWMFKGYCCSSEASKGESVKQFPSHTSEVKILLKSCIVDTQSQSEDFFEDKRSRVRLAITEHEEREREKGNANDYNRSGELPLIFLSCFTHCPALRTESSLMLTWPLLFSCALYLTSGLCILRLGSVEAMCTSLAV